MVLRANVDVMVAIRRSYVGLKTDKDFPDILKRECQNDIDSFAANADEISGMLKMHIVRAELLVGLVHDRKELVCSIPIVID